jgi:pimeloyl-ACP methyl ester carboxylesterase
MLLHGLPGCGEQWHEVASMLAQVCLCPTFAGFEDGAGTALFPQTADHASQILEWAAGRTDDLAVIAWSFACHPLLYAMTRLDFAPAMALFYEPGSDSYVTGDDLAAFAATSGEVFGPVFATLEDASDEALVRTLFAATGEPTSFDQLSQDMQNVFVRKAASMRLAFSGPDGPAHITAQEIRKSSPGNYHVLYGDRTRPMFRIAAERLASHLPGAKLTCIQDADHMMPITQPERFADLLCSAIESREAT